MTDELILQKRLNELAQRSYDRGVFTFTDFMGLSEIDVYMRMQSALSYAAPSLWGGLDGCERVMLRFGDSDTIGWEEPFPIACITAKPRSQKYADALTHRDILGALMNQGIQREKVGDIYIRDNIAYFFCTETIAETLAADLTRAKHTQLDCAVLAQAPNGLLSATSTEIYQIASERMDCLVAAVCRISREKCLALFRSKKIFVNGRQCENNSAALKTNTVISVRGTGRFRYTGVASVSRKGKYNVTVERYV